MAEPGTWIVMGGKLGRALLDERIQTRNAIDEILKFYHVKPGDLFAYILRSLETSDYLLAAGATLLVALVGMLIPAITCIIYGPVGRGLYPRGAPAL